MYARLYRFGTPTPTRGGQSTVYRLFRIGLEYAKTEMNVSLTTSKRYT